MFRDVLLKQIGYKLPLRKAVALMCLVVSLSPLWAGSALAQDWVKTKLSASTRHMEWIDVKNGDRTIKCFIAYPESKKKSPAVVVIHEIFGLTDWVRQVCDDFAAEGFIAIAPDLLSGKPGEESSKYATVDDARKAVSALPREQVAADLKAVADKVASLPSCDRKVSVAGFCWGGSKTWSAITTNPDLKSAFVFYGTPDAAAQSFDKIKAPVYGFYAEKDNRVTSTLDDTSKKMKDASKQYEHEIYTGAQHGFMRIGEAPDADAANADARKKAWEKMLKKLRTN
jgi:carboxymethylenebutenolidase